MGHAGQLTNAAGPAGPGRTTKRRTALVVLASLFSALAALVGSAGPASASTITSPGPLTNITISPDLNCAVNHVQDSAGEFYGDTACGTLLATGGTLFGPASIPAGGGASPRTGFTPVSQASGGSGTSADPFTIVTVVDAGTTGVRLTQTDSYVVGQESYRTDTQVTNTGAAPLSAVLYKAGDCYLQNSDLGFGAYDAATGAVSCVAGVDDGTGPVVPGSRIEQFFPLTPGSSYLESYYSSVWGAVGTQQPLPNLCDQCADYVDNGIGLSWSLSLAPGASAVVSHFTTFSPLGIVPLTTTKTADSATAAPGAAGGYTITVANPNATQVTLDSIIDTLPPGFSYTAGSSTGATTADPVVSGQDLTWSGPLSVPAGSSLSLHFAVTVSATPGTYLNHAGATSTSVAVAPTGPTAQITVSGAPPNTAPSVEAGGPYAGPEGASVALDATVGDPDAADTVTSTWSWTPGAGVDSGAACSFADASAVDTSVTCTDDGSYALTLSASDGGPAVTDTAVLTVGNADPTVAVSAPADMSLHLVGSTVTLTATFADAGANDTHTCSIDWGDGSVEAGTIGAGTCSGSHAYSSIATPTISVSVSDDDGGTGSADVVVVIFDRATKVTGGGFVVGDGPTSFGFVAKQAPDGTLSGQVQVRAPGKHRFHGDTVTTMASSANTAQWGGAGRCDGVGGHTYEVSVVDNRNGGGRKGTADTIHIVVRDATGAVVLDVSGPLQGGNLTVHR
jgi:uncharacterized repeat protein (TIGR01451 family)